MKSSYPPKMITKGLFKENGKHNVDKLRTLVSKKDTVFYRNNADRRVDLINMNVIVNEFLNI